jgi:cyclic pyranopterin phosphate synthase
MNRLTHLADDGSVQMVDVSVKERSAREAIAAGRIQLGRETLDLIAKNHIGKGNVFATARIAGIQAAKQTSQLVPLCHNLNLSHVEIEIVTSESGLEVKCVARTVAQTGVEMEALTGIAVALLTIYDMCKAVDKEMRITDIRLLKKTKRDVGELE